MAYKDVINDIATDFYWDRLVEMINDNKELKEQFSKMPRPLQEKLIDSMINKMKEDTFEQIFWEWSEFYKWIQPILDKEQLENI